MEWLMRFAATFAIMVLGFALIMGSVIAAEHIGNAINVSGPLVYGMIVCLLTAAAAATFGPK